MPVIRNTPPEYPKVDELVSELVRELSASAESGEDAPLIYEEESRPGPRGVFFAVTVFWENPKWRALDFQTRSRVVLKAYEQARPDDATRITRAMGLTRQEAHKLGIEVPG